MPRIATNLLVGLFIGMLVGSDARPQTPVSTPASGVIETRNRTIRVPFQIARQEPATTDIHGRIESRSGAPSSRSKAEEPIPLAPPSGGPATGQSKTPVRGSRAGIATVVFSSLAVVLGLFFLVVWLSRRALPRAGTSLPSDVLEVLGRAPLAGHHNLQLIRLGSRLLLVSVTADGAQTLAEISDVDEVNHLSGLCRQNQPGSITASFRHVLTQFGSSSAESQDLRGRTLVNREPHTGQELPVRQTGSR